MLAAVCMRPVVTIEARVSVRDAARLMREKRVGALVVATSRKPKGIITDRDIAMAVVAEGRDPAEVPVGDVMRWKPAVIREDKGILDALRLLDDLLCSLGTEMGHVAAALSRSLCRRTTP